jgi:hypothetical protein
MRTQQADPLTRPRPTRGLVTRPLASVLLAMGAVSLAAASGSATGCFSGANVAAETVLLSSARNPTATTTAIATGQTVTGDRAPAPG